MSSFYIRNVFDAPSPFYLMNIMKTSKDYMLDFHSHDRYHINVITEGAVTVITNEKSMVVRKGSVFIMPPHIPHKLCSEEGYMQKGADVSVGNVGYGVSDILCEISEGSPVQMPVHNMNIIDCIAEKNLRNPSDFAAIKCANAFTSMIIDIVEKKNRKANSFRNEFSCAANELADKFSLLALCEKMAYSKTHLERLVKQEFGCTAIEYMERMRFAKVCNLLVSTDEPLCVIAEKCGFYDAAHLSVFFKKRSGISPGKYRNECR